MHVRHQIGVLSKVASAFLIPDNHIGRATVSSIAVAHEVERMGGRSIACLNARDRNLLGFRRDLLTAAAYGVDQFLFVYGDRPTSGTSHRPAHRALDDRRAPRLLLDAETRTPFRVGVAAGPGPLPGVEARRRLPVRPGPVLARRPARVAATRSTSTAPSTPGSWWCRARRWPASSAPTSRSSPSPTRGSTRSSATRTPASSSRATSSAGVRASGAFDGVHLIPVSRYREVAANLEARALVRPASSVPSSISRVASVAGVGTRSPRSLRPF